jgi:hypothetical protein
MAGYYHRYMAELDYRRPTSPHVLQGNHSIPLKIAS